MSARILGRDNMSDKAKAGKLSGRLIFDLILLRAARYSMASMLLGLDITLLILLLETDEELFEGLFLTISFFWR